MHNPDENTTTSRKTKPILDKDGIYDRVREKTIKEFEERRETLVKKGLDGIKHYLYDKIGPDIDIYENEGRLDLLSFNKFAEMCAGQLLYVRCVLNHIPRSSPEGLSGKRKEKVL